MKHKWLQKLFPLAAMFVLSTPLLFGQASNGSIVGSTSDAQGALYFAADAFSRLGWDIRSARVSNWRGEVRASFYVAGVRQLSEAEARQALARLQTRAPASPPVSVAPQPSRKPTAAGRGVPHAAPLSAAK